MTTIVPMSQRGPDLNRPDLWVSISSTHEIAAEHHLPYHTGKCRRRHGHNYRIIFTKYGKVQTGTHSSAGMVEDFGDLDTAIKRVLTRIDHWSLNDDVRLPNPTAEHLAIWLLDQLPMIDKVEVWETSKHCATVERDRRFEKVDWSKVPMQPLPDDPAVSSIVTSYDPEINTTL